MKLPFRLKATASFAVERMVMPHVPNQGDRSREHQASLTDEERRLKERRKFNFYLCLVQYVHAHFSKVFTSVPIENHM